MADSGKVKVHIVQRWCLSKEYLLDLGVNCASIMVTGVTSGTALPCKIGTTVTWGYCWLTWTFHSHEHRPP